MQGLLRRCFSTSQVRSQVQKSAPSATAVKLPKVPTVDKIKALTERYEHLSRMLEIEATNQNQLVIQQKYLTKGSQFFIHKDMEKHGMKLVHSIYYGEQLRAFRKGIETDDYAFYDEYPYCPEILIVGSSNAGKSSLINALNDTVTTSKVSKKSGKTQCLNFFLC